MSKVPNFLFCSKGEISMDLITKLSYKQGKLPDKYWYQLNGRSATENYIEQRFKTLDEEEEVIIRSEVCVK